MLTIENLGKQIQGQWLFRNLNLEIQARKSIALLGPSGSGKTLLLKMIAGLISPDEGSVSLKTREIGMLFQQNALFDFLTVEDNLYFPLKKNKNITGAVARQSVSRLLKAVHLEGSETLYPGEISGGMQKRLGIARALILEPELILYDDPTAGLDPVTSRVIVELILELQKEHKATVICVTNDYEKANDLAERLYLLTDGELHEASPLTEPLFQEFVFGQ